MPAVGEAAHPAQALAAMSPAISVFRNDISFLRSTLLCPSS